jgi:hypothetical protein
MVNTDNSIEEEIKERIAAGNRAFHVHKDDLHQNEYPETSNYKFIAH